MTRSAAANTAVPANRRPPDTSAPADGAVAWAALSGLPHAVAVLDGEGRFIHANPPWARFVEDSGGYFPVSWADESYLAALERGAAAGRPGADVMAHELRALLVGRSETFRHEYSCDSPHGTCRFEVTAQALSLNGGRGCVVTHVDVSHHQRAVDQAVLTSRQTLQALIDASDDSICMYDREGRILAANNKKASVVGTTPRGLVGRKLAEVMPPKDAFVRLSAIWQALNAGGTAHLEAPYKGRLYDLRMSPVFDNEGQSFAVTSVGRDVTERRASEEQVRQSLRLESLGLLAGGLAHDLNNLLHPILALGKRIRRALPEDDERARRYLDTVIESAQRASEVVSKVLMFSSRERHSRTRIPFGRHVASAVGLLKEILPSTVNVKDDIRDETLEVMGTPGEVTQVVINLVQNAAEAMDDSGEVRVSLSEVEDAGHLSSGVQGEGAHGETRRWLVLRVADTGTGIDQSIRHRIFDPFFTTKPPGKGTGLGLSVVHGIVGGWGGTIFVEGDPGGGALVEIYIPACTEGPDNNGNNPGR